MSNTFKVQNYNKLEEKRCSFHGSYGSYDNYYAAVIACNQDTKCKGVWDSDCSNIGHSSNFRLCSTGWNYEDSPYSSSDCIHDKLGRF